MSALSDAVRRATLDDMLKARALLAMLRRHGVVILVSNDCGMHAVNSSRLTVDHVAALSKLRDAVCAVQMRAAL